jgi:spermidine synthase
VKCHQRSTREGEALSTLGLSFCLVLSGAAGLIYQIAWAKSLALLFGTSAYSLATVLAVFMGGLALGSAWFGRRAERAQNAIALYGWVELAVAATGALSLAGLACVHSLYLRQGPALGDARTLLIVARVLGTALVLLVPTFLMGGTLPIVVRGVVRQSARLAIYVSRFYALNTFGGVAGALAAGLLTVPWVGLRLTVASAVVLNVIAGFLALRLASVISTGSPIALEKAHAEIGDVKHRSSQSEAGSAYLLAVFAFIGGTAISYEISWTRLLAAVLGSSSYAFTLMLATFLAGIGLGGILFERWSASGQTVTVRTIAATQCAVAASAILFLVFYSEAPTLIPPILHATSNAFAGMAFAEFVVCALIMLPAAVIFGFNFPAVVTLIAQAESGISRASLSVGRAYAANTCGAIAAALLTGFFLAPLFGSYRVVALCAAVNLFLAVILEICAPSRRAAIVLMYTAALGIVVIMGWSTPFFNPRLATFNPVLYAGHQQYPLTINEIANTLDVVFLEDGVSATIAVARSDNYIALKTNGKVDASNVDSSTQLLLGDLGGVFHAHPRRVLIIGFGGGMTASAIARFPDVERIDCVEIEPAVLHAAHYLQRLHRNVLSDSRLHFIFDDARNFVQMSPNSYDLIISEPSNPWVAGVSSLYTTEFYDHIRQHLNNGGVFVQWVQAYSLATDDFRSILATLAPHFFDITLWHAEGRDLLLMARTDTSPLNFQRSRSFWSSSALQEDFHSLHLTRPESWPVYFRWSDAEVRRIAAGAPAFTDDHNSLEYRAARAIVQEGLADELEALINRNQGKLLPTELAPKETRFAQWGSAESATEMQMDRAMDYVKAISDEKDSPAFQTLLGKAYLIQGNLEAAIELFQSPEIEQAGLYGIRLWLAKALYETGDRNGAAAQLNTALASDPRNTEILRAQVNLARASRQWERALAAQEMVVEFQFDPQPEDLCELGDLHLRSGDASGSEKLFLEGLTREPYSYLCRRDLGELQRIRGLGSEAERNLEFVIQFFPTANPRSYASLALAYQAERLTLKAQSILAKGLRIFPGDPGLLQLERQLN